MRSDVWTGTTQVETEKGLTDKLRPNESKQNLLALRPFIWFCSRAKNYDWKLYINMLYSRLFDTVSFYMLNIEHRKLRKRMLWWRTKQPRTSSSFTMKCNFPITRQIFHSQRLNRLILKRNNSTEEKNLIQTILWHCVHCAFIWLSLGYIFMFFNSLWPCIVEFS